MCISVWLMTYEEDLQWTIQEMLRSNPHFCVVSVLPSTVAALVFPLAVCSRLHVRSHAVRDMVVHARGVVVGLAVAVFCRVLPRRASGRVQYRS